MFQFRKKDEKLFDDFVKEYMKKDDININKRNNLLSQLRMRLRKDKVD